MKVAIVKSRVYKGGVTQVLASMIQVLNDKGIIPDLVTLKSDVDEEIVKKNYGQDIRFHVRKIAINLRMPYEWHFLYFNLISRNYLHNYDLIIDSNNTSFLGQSKIPSINYTHYPRKDRVISNLYSQHLPEGPKKNIFDLKTDPFYLAKFLYRFDNKMKRKERIICNSKFTAKKVSEVYPIKNENLEILYPPVQFPNKKVESKKQKTVVSLGRFSEEKRQLEQLEIAQQLPEYNFKIIGFSGNGKYLMECKNKLESEKIKNVEILADIDFAEIEKIMSESQFFIHNVRNEPFGISTVQAIAYGCIPVVHNSGGSKEIVNNESLKFNSANECITRFQNLSLKHVDEMNSMRDAIHLKEYSKEYFMQQFEKILMNYIQ
jgi:glycosyltransferase involved in cell wall biosynthesis